MPPTPTRCATQYPDASTTSPSTRTSAREAPEAGAAQSNPMPMPEAPRPSANRNIVSRVRRTAASDHPLPSMALRPAIGFPFVYMADSREALADQSTRTLRRRKSREFGAPSRVRGGIGSHRTFHLGNSAAPPVPHPMITACERATPRAGDTQPRLRPAPILCCGQPPTGAHYPYREAPAGFAAGFSSSQAHGGGTSCRSPIA